MARARGANATSALAFEAVYGQPPAGDWFALPFVSSGLGSEQALVDDDVLGQGREPSMPGDDVVTNTGDIVLPVDVRALGLALTALLGEPTTTPGIAARGALTFSAQPASNATITLAGQAFTFVSGTPTANQIKIGATLAETIANAVRALNASAVADVAAASYSADIDGKTLRIVHDALGTAGNSVTLAAGSSPASNATVSAATLTGGAASGAYNHVWTSGAATLPSFSHEVGHPEVPSYSVETGCVANTLTLPLARSGNFNATLAVIAQNTVNADASVAGTPTTFDYERFSHFSAQVEDGGVPMAELTSGSIVLSNNLEAVEVIRRDGAIAGADPGKFSARGEYALLFSGTSIRARAEASETLNLIHSWSAGPNKTLTVRVPRLKLPRKAKKAVNGPAGVSVTYAGQGVKAPDLGKSVIVTLVNDVPSYALA